jgi:hypothetical protein
MQFSVLTDFVSLRSFGFFIAGEKLIPVLSSHTTIYFFRVAEVGLLFL